jgi:hypothetical protein
MSDALQTVTWAIERYCPFRRGIDWQYPCKTSSQLRLLRECSGAEQDGRIFQGIVITSHYFTANDTELPADGFPVGVATCSAGGLQRVKAICGACEANAAYRGNGFAGCHGSFFVDGSAEAEEHLQGRLANPALRERWEASFVSTQPIWFGLWINSPLLTPACEVLLELLDGFKAEDFARFRDFIAALKALQRGGLRLFTHFASPGHCDFGIITTYAHCPRCKAESPDERWKPVPSRMIECEVCGFDYNPSTTKASERVDEPSSADLMIQLGTDYDSFALRYCTSRGYSESQVIEALNMNRRGPVDASSEE